MCGYGSFGVWLSDLLINAANRSIGIGRMVVVLCSLEISFIVCKYYGANADSILPLLVSQTSRLGTCPALPTVEAQGAGE
jgi:hypothetical protein